MCAASSTVTLATARWRRWIGVMLVAYAVVLVLSPAAAQFARGLGQFSHTRWTTDDGVPATGVVNLAQTPDGWLWITSSEGLFRFDGVTFEKIPAPVGSPMERASPASLFVTRSGELWVNYAQGGGVAVYRNGKLRAVPVAERRLSIAVVAQTPDGALWAQGEGRHGDHFFRGSGGKWESMDERLGVPDGFNGPLCVTADGTLWYAPAPEVADKVLFLTLPPGAERLRTTTLAAYGWSTCATDREGRMWVADKRGTRMVVGANGKILAHPVLYPPLPKLDSAALAFDFAGGLWGGTPSTGVFYIPRAAIPNRTKEDRLEQFVAADGLTSDGVYKPFIDREGNIWFGSDAGLNRFRRSSAIREMRVPGDPGQGYGMVGTGDAIFVTTADGVFQLARDGPRKLLGHGVAGTCPAVDGGFWGVRTSEILRVRGSERRSIALPRDVQLTGSCIEDRSGRLWVTLYEGGAMWRDATGWHRPAKPLPNVMWPDLVLGSDGGPAYVSNDALVRPNAAGAVTTPLARYDIGEIMKLSAGRRDIFISGNNGLLRIRGNRVARIDARRFPWVARLRDLAQTPSGETWLRRALWVSKVSTKDLDRAFDDPNAPLPRSYFDLRDGVMPAQGTSFTGPQMGVGGDGRIWLVDRQGLAFIDPARLNRITRPPPVVIRALASGGTVHRDPRHLSLAAGTRALDIGYTALSYAVPHRIEFRYRLDGVDQDWVSPGTRRLASYTNLGPGTYRFRVVATNGNGVWNAQGATLEFEIPPTFVQSWPFKLLCAMIVLASLWVAYSLRLRTVASGIRARMADRIAERERIARDLHDTLLQSVQALTLRFQLVVDELPVGERSRPALEAAIDRADQVIAEGRDRVKDLRPSEEGGDIAKIVTEIVAQQGFDPGVAVSIETVGTARNLDSLALDEIVRIGGEALFNVRRHAEATRIAIEIRYQADFAICIVDNGVGIAGAVLEHGGKDGHFGLMGMRERARKLDGDLLIRRIPEGGTQVVLTVPGGIAYQKRVWRWRWWS